jgi:sialic acid synthase
MRELFIENTRIADDSDSYVIAEIGHNHQGSLEKAKEMFRIAKECGVNAVKLQKRDNRSLYTKAMYNSSYENENSFGSTYGEHREALEFGRAEYIELQEYAKNLNLTLFATAWDFKSVDFLAELNMPAYKVASGDVLSFPLLTYMAKVGKPMIISTGGATMDDVNRMVDVLLPINPKICILQCTANYPAEPGDMNLRVVTTFREAFPELVVGLSDHQNGIAMSVAAYVLGARVFEKHFTLNRSLKGTDHSFSLEPAGMHKLVRDLQRTRVALGDGIKRRLPGEEKPIRKMSKKLVAACDLPAGHILRRDDVALKSPGDGLPACELDRVIGMRLLAPLKEDDNIITENLKHN